MTKLTNPGTRYEMGVVTGLEGDGSVIGGGGGRDLFSGREGGVGELGQARLAVVFNIFIKFLKFTFLYHL